MKENKKKSKYKNKEQKIKKISEIMTSKNLTIKKINKRIRDIISPNKTQLKM